MTQLNPIAPQVWGADTRISIGAGASLPLRMTVVQDADGLTLVSPIELTEALKAELDALGPVRTIIGPNLLHYRWLGSAKSAYPDAQVLAPSGLREKRPEISFDAALEAGSHAGPLQIFLLEGAPKLSEYVFFHQASKTLIVTDLVFNIAEASGMTWLILKTVSRALGFVEQSRLLRMFTEDRQSAAESLGRILELPFERVVPAHGDIIEKHANAELTTGTWWMRGEKQRPSLRA